MNLGESPAKTCEIHLWKYCLQDRLPEISLTWFSREERDNIANIGSPERRKLFLRVHAFLRVILGRYSHLPPDQVRLVKGVKNKPYLKSDHVDPPFFFSLAYRHDYSLLAISNERCIGVDVEEIKEFDEWLPFLFEHFSENERIRILSEDTHHRQLSTLYSLWTMKEAVVKSLGIGLPGRLSKYDLSSFLDAPAEPQKIGSSPDWRIEPVHLSQHYKASIACRSRYVRIKMFSYTGE